MKYFLTIVFLAISWFQIFAADHCSDPAHCTGFPECPGSDGCPATDFVTYTYHCKYKNGPVCKELKSYCEGCNKKNWFIDLNSCIDNCPPKCNKNQNCKASDVTVYSYACNSNTKHCDQIKLCRGCPGQNRYKDSGECSRYCK